KYKINCQHEKAKTDEMIEPEGLIFKEYHRKEDENEQGYDFLQHLKLNQRKRAAHFTVADAVGRHLKEILEQCDAPADEHNRNQSQVFEPFQFFEFEVSVPGQGHESVGKDQQQNGVEGFHGVEF